MIKNTREMKGDFVDCQCERDRGGVKFLRKQELDRSRKPGRTFSERYAVSEGCAIRPKTRDMNMTEKHRLYGSSPSPERRTLIPYNGVTKAIQTEAYSYDGSGNLTKKGTLNYTYNPANHAVTKVTSVETGDINYIYDASGNMTARAGDSFQYDSMGRLVKASLSNNTDYELTYDWQNQKIKKLNMKDQGTVYSIDGFELTRLPGQTEKHTVYVRGQQGELAAQLTMGESRLVSGDVPFDYAQGTDIAAQGTAPLGERSRTKLKEAIPYWLFPLLALSLIAFLPLHAIPYIAAAASIALLSCGPSAGSNKKDPPFWLAGATNSTANTTSIVHPNSSNPASGSRPTSGGGGANPAATPVTGMYFFHPDHLGSVSMVTDGYGKMVTGMDIDSGMSYITYKPYGEINRTNSSGPDIYRYKYTAQEDDPELGLYYYKARWYDPNIARFTQADSIIDANSVQGMNQYMYTEGNPVNFRDPSGFSKSSGGMAGIIHAFNTHFKNTQNDWNHWAKNIQNDFNPWMKNLQNDFNPWMKNIQNDFNPWMKKKIEGYNKLTYRIFHHGHHRDNNDLDRNNLGFLSEDGRFFDNLVRSDIGIIGTRNRACIELAAEIYFLGIPAFGELGYLMSGGESAAEGSIFAKYAEESTLSRLYGDIFGEILGLNRPSRVLFRVSSSIYSAHKSSHECTLRSL